ncbi:MAG TPA: SpoIID/LytB domain-containing protein [Bryobacteraceae bacterium]|nr:SpoIID/LytB domain-containing protein [Bryobacteraceae bacterium]
MPGSLSRRSALAGLLALPGAGRCAAVTSEPLCSVWVFRLLRPVKLLIYPQAGCRLHCASPAGFTVVEGRGSFSANARTTPLHVSGPQGSPVPLVLEIPRVIRRAYVGTLNVESSGELLIPVISMSREVAVSSILGAELPAANTPFQALAAQAVIARSFLAATREPRHREAKFCDTTHCQFLRSPAVPGTPPAQAASFTRKLILNGAREMIPARYSAACGGRTDNRWEEGYLYQSVECEVCRQLGLTRRGHGLGMCQEGAMGLARAGWHWRAIVAKYYPGASVQTEPESGYQERSPR